MICVDVFTLLILVLKHFAVFCDYFMEHTERLKSKMKSRLNKIYKRYMTIIYIRDFLLIVMINFVPSVSDIILEIFQILLIIYISQDCMYISINCVYLD